MVTRVDGKIFQAFPLVDAFGGAVCVLVFDSEDAFRDGTERSSFRKYTYSPEVSFVEASTRARDEDGRREKAESIFFSGSLGRRQ
jgi:hypothetical protein